MDESRIADEEQFDGVWALRTNVPLTATEVVLKYKQLWHVEQSFREAKSLLRTRPIYHRRDETIREHVFCSFLALVLKQELERRLETAGIAVEWGDLLRDLGRLRETEVELQGKRFVARSKAYGAVGKVVLCVGARLPTDRMACGAGRPGTCAASSLNASTASTVRPTRAVLCQTLNRVSQLVSIQ